MTVVCSKLLPCYHCCSETIVVLKQLLFHYNCCYSITVIHVYCIDLWLLFLLLIKCVACLTWVSVHFDFNRYSILYFWEFVVPFLVVVQIRSCYLVPIDYNYCYIHRLRCCFSILFIKIVVVPFLAIWRSSLLWCAEGLKL